MITRRTIGKTIVAAARPFNGRTAHAEEFLVAQSIMSPILHTESVCSEIRPSAPAAATRSSLPCSHLQGILYQSA